MRWILYVITLFFLGCNDNGTGTQDIQTVPFIFKKETMSITNHTPQKYVAKRSYIAVEFSSQLSNEDLAQKITITDETNKAGIEFDYDIVENILYILPKSSLVDQHTYRFDFSHEIKDIFDNQLESANTFELICKSNFWENVEAGDKHSIAKSKDGDIYMWGSNLYGELHDFTINQRSSPLPVTKLRDCNKSSAGGDQSGFILKDHNFISFGKDAIGEVSGDYIDLSVGGDHASAIKSDHTLWSYGANNVGQLGNLGINSQSTFVQEYSKSKNWKQVSCGSSFSVAIKEDATLWGWGANDYGELGSSEYNQRRRPAQEDTNATNWKFVSAGGEHTCALKLDNTLVCFGNNDKGQLGDNTFESNKTKRSHVINPNAQEWIDVRCGFNHTLALDSNHTLWGWGDNYYGELGQGDTTNRNKPQKILDNVSSFSAGSYFSLAVKRDGTIWAWGYNAFFQLGLGESDDQLIPQEIK